MKFWIGVLVALLLACHAKAEELAFDLTGTAYTPENPYYPGAGPFDISFQLDTMSGVPSFVFGGGCLQHFGVTGASLTNFQSTLNGLSGLPSSALTNFGGDNANGSCGSDFFAALKFDTPSVSGWWEFDPHPGITQVQFLASTDPVAALFESFQEYPSYAVVQTPTGTFDLAFDKVSVAPVDVPEPGTLVLMALGLAAVLMEHRWRRHWLKSRCIEVCERCRAWRWVSK